MTVEEKRTQIVSFLIFHGVSETPTLAENTSKKLKTAARRKKRNEILQWIYEFSSFCSRITKSKPTQQQPQPDRERIRFFNGFKMSGDAINSVLNWNLHFLWGLCVCSPFVFRIVFKPHSSLMLFHCFSIFSDFPIFTPYIFGVFFNFSIGLPEGHKEAFWRSTIEISRYCIRIRVAFVAWNFRVD